MDMGVMAAWKSHFRHTFLNDMIVTMEAREDCKRTAILNKSKAGMKGISEGHDPNMFDVSERVS